MLTLVWLIPLLRFAGFVVNGLLGRRILSKGAVSVLAYRLMLRIGRLPEDERVLR